MNPMSKHDINIDIETPMKIHLMGIGGAGMSGLAVLLDAIGHTVSGCDMENTFYLNKVRQEGIQVVIGHHREHIDTFAPDLIIYTSAIAQDHPELIEARRRGITVAKRADVLSIIFNRSEGVGIAGTHGKTTTSSMISMIAERAGIEPTVAIGGELTDIGCNAKLGRGRYMIAELDESDGSFELFSPVVTVVTNVDWDHIDHYPHFEDVIDAFRSYITGRKPNTPLIICAEDKGTSILLKDESMSDAITYGWGTSWRWGAMSVEHHPGGGVSYEAYKDGAKVADITLRLSGDHNVLNSLAALAASDCMDIDIDRARSALAEFSGAKRRLQFVGEANEIKIYDDYGHHPAEIAATVSAVKKAFPDRKITAIFQPHRYTRTEALYKDIATVLQKVDNVFLLPIYSADEQPISGVSSFMIADELLKAGKSSTQVCGDFQEAVKLVCDSAQPGSLILTIGAGNIEYLSKQIFASLQKKNSQA